MEDILRVYNRPPDPARPLVCFDEAGKALRREVRPSLPVIPGHAAREDGEYDRNGSANLFLWVAPHLGQRQVTVTAQRTALDVAHALREVLDVPFPHAERVVLVTDQLNVHEPASFDKAFPPAEAARLWSRLEWHYTPTHGSWLNMAEREWSVLGRHWLDRRIPDRETLEAEVRAWDEDRTYAGVRHNWRFDVAQARTTLAHLYPIPEDAI